MEKQQHGSACREYSATKRSRSDSLGVDAISFAVTYSGKASGQIQETVLAKHDRAIATDR